MQSKFARIGRTYPRLDPDVDEPRRAPRIPRRYRITGGLIAVLSALGLLGWFLAR
jgi:hypothetical protein